MKGCPGKKACSARQVQRSCRGCRHMPGPIPAGDAVWLPWLHHLQRLANLLALGATIRPGDLAPREWDGLILLEAARARTLTKDKV